MMGQKHQLCLFEVSEESSNWAPGFLCQTPETKNEHENGLLEWASRNPFADGDRFLSFFKNGFGKNEHLVVADIW